MAFALTMAVLFIALTILLLGMMAPNASLNTGVIGLTTNSGKFASNNMSAVQAFNLAESGIDLTVEYFHNLAAPPANTTAFAPIPNGSWGCTTAGSPARSVVSMSINGNTGTFSVEVYPNSANSGSAQKKYLIESVGTYNGFSELVSAYIEQTSFGEYSYFNDEEESGGYWVAGTDTFNGPMHSNNANSADVPGTVPTNILWYQNAADTMFDYDGADAFTCVSPTIAWNLNSVGNMVGPATSTDWTDVAIGGGSTVAPGQADVPMPSTSSVEMTAALGGTTAPSGTSPQVIVPSAGGTATGGIYINGNVTEMALSTANNGVVQVVTVTQQNTTAVPAQTIVTTVTMDPTQNTTTVSTATTPAGGSTTTTSASYTGTTNGVVYVNGDVGAQNSAGTTPSAATDAGLDSTDEWGSGTYQYSFGSSGTSSYKSGGVHGVIADNYYNSSGNLVHASGVTIATNAANNLNFDGSLTTNTQRAQSGGAYVPESQDTNYTSKAGTLGVVSDNVEVVQNSYTGSALTTMEVDGDVMAYNTFDADAIYQRSVGNFTVMGGYIAKKGGYFGVMNGSGTMLQGFNEHYDYDARLANDPPPYFPTTGANYQIVSWTRQNATSTLQ